MDKKSKSHRMYKQKRRNNQVWVFLLVGILVLFLGTILAFLVVSSDSDEPTMMEASAVNVEKDIPETDMGDLVYHEPAAENVVMQGGFGYVNNELLVTLDSAESLPALKEYLAGIGGEVVGEIPLTADYQIMLSGTYSREELEALTEQVKSLSYVERSSLNYAFELEDASEQYYPDDPKWDNWKSTGGNNWNMKAIDAPGAWAYRNQMGPVNVGVIDSIFNPYHEDLSFEEMPLGNVTDMGVLKFNRLEQWTMEESHGTHVSGIMGAVFDNGVGICGVAANAKIYGVDAHSDSVMKYSRTGEYYKSDTYWLKIALAHLVASKRCQVINFSQGLAENLIYSASHGDEGLRVEIENENSNIAEFLRILKSKVENEFVICQAAGNGENKLFFKKDAEDTENYLYLSYEDYQKYMEGDSSKSKIFQRYSGRISEENCVSGGMDRRYDILGGITSPEIEDVIVVVGAVRNKGNHSEGGCYHNGYELAEYSNGGSKVDVVAPGGDGTSRTCMDAWIYSTVACDDGYGYMDGTSMAAPHVAGVAAMIFGIDPTFTAKEVKDVIVSTATGSYGGGGFRDERCGLLNAKLAVEKAIELRDKKAEEKKEKALSDEPTGEHRYKIYYDTLTWEEAKEACEAKGGHLATITSKEEQQTLNLYNAGNHKLWIGGYKNTEGQWCWVTGEPWVYENWGDGEPNNSSNVVAGESCVAMWPEKWNDLANSNVYEQSGYICEWEASSSEKNTEDDGHTGHIYEFYTLPESEWESGPITWEQAERRCEWKGGHLAVIESQTENDYLYNMMKEKGYENACFGYSDKEKEGVWKWVDGSQSAYTNWHTGEPNNQDGNENYAMFYQKFDDGTWNDGSGIIDAGCAYICEWDDPADRQQGDTFTDRQLGIIARDLGVPDGLDVEITQSPKTYWEAAGIWDIYVEITLGEKVIASGSFDVETGEMGRNLYIYSPNQ